MSSQNKKPSIMFQKIESRDEFEDKTVLRRQRLLITFVNRFGHETRYKLALGDVIEQMPQHIIDDFNINTIEMPTNISYGKEVRILKPNGCTCFERPQFFKIKLGFNKSKIVVSYDIPADKKTYCVNCGDIVMEFVRSKV